MEQTLFSLSKRKRSVSVFFIPTINSLTASDWLIHILAASRREQCCGPVGSRLATSDLEVWILSKKVGYVEVLCARPRGITQGQSFS